MERVNRCHMDAAYVARYMTPQLTCTLADWSCSVSCIQFSAYPTGEFTHGGAIMSGNSLWDCFGKEELAGAIPAYKWVQTPVGKTCGKAWRTNGRRREMDKKGN